MPHGVIIFRLPVGLPPLKPPLYVPALAVKVKSLCHVNYGVITVIKIGEDNIKYE